MSIHGFLGGVISATAPTVSSAGASGIFTLEEQMQAAGTWPVGGYYLISRSVRIRASASAYFSRTPSSATNRSTWTYSAWIKKAPIDFNTSMSLLSAGSFGSDLFTIQITDNGLSVPCVAVYGQISGSAVLNIAETPARRDPSAWFHLVVVLDTTQATASNRLKLYYNGAQVTALTTATYPNQNTTFAINNNQATAIGSRAGGGAPYYDGYLTEINFVDGQALTPSSFGATDATTGVWNPIAYTGTYGTNGFYLNFSDNSGATATTIGKDSSGNGNNWTPNNISVTAGTTYDSMVDVPIGYGGDTGVGGELRGNYATFSAVDYFGSPGLSEANLTISGTSPGDFGTIKLTSGKWYFEFRKNADGDNQLGIASGNAYQSSGNLGTTCFRRTWRDNVGTPSWLTDSGTPGSGTAQSLTTGDILGVALDLDNNAVYFAKNNTWMNSGVPTSGSSKTGAIWTDLSGGTWQIYAGGNSNGCYTTLNAGQRPFTYTAPSGFKVFCTQNLPAPTITNGANHMAATTYSGTGATQTVSNTVNSISFQPDFAWFKSRSTATNNVLHDVLRGTGGLYRLFSDLTNAESTTGDGFSALASNGFTLDSTGSGGDVNTSGRTYVSWQWKGGGTGVSNTAGSITSTVSANTTAGFNILTYTGTGATATIGHGLGAVPSMMIMKKRSAVGGWKVYHTVLGNTKIVELNDPGAAQTSSTYWNNTSPTSTLITVGSNADINASSETYVSYCWTAISGYSAFGSYTGNASSDGPFVYFGFRPRYVMLKRSDTGGTNYNWFVYDSARDKYNATQNYLEVNLTSAEQTSVPVDFLSNGFKVRTASQYWNASGGTFIYAAFAENPFKIARAR